MLSSAPMQKSSATPPPSAPEPAREDIRYRREILIQAQQVVQQIDALDDQLEFFREFDQPAYQAWHQQTFARELQTLAALESEFAQGVQLHNDMVALVKLRRVSMPRAFEILRAEQAAYANGSESQRRRIEEQRLKRADFIRLELQEAPTPHQCVGDGPLTEATPPPSPTPIEGEQIKLVYRKLVRRLHPDLQGPRADAGELRWQKRIWDLAHSARQRGDAAELELLYKVTLLRQMDFAELTVAQAHDVYAWLRSEFDRLNTLVWQAQQSPAWGFSRQQDLRRLADTLQKRLQDDILALQAEVEELNGQHAYLEVLSYSPRPSRKRSSTRRNENQLSLFD